MKPEQKLTTRWYVYEGEKTACVRPDTLVMRTYTDKADKLEGETIFVSLLKPIATPSLSAAFSSLIPIANYIQARKDKELTNWDFKNLLDIRAGIGPLLPNGKPAYIRNFQVSAFLLPHIRLFLEALDPNLERQNNSLGEKPIIIRGMSIVNGELYIERKIAAMTRESGNAALTEYQNVKRSFDRLLLESLPMGDML